MLSKDAKKYLKEVNQTVTKKQSIFSIIEDDIMGLYDAGLTYEQIWDYSKTKIEDMPKAKNSLVNFIQVRIKKRKKLAANNPYSEQKNNKESVAGQQVSTEPISQDQHVDHNDDYDDYMRVAKERIELSK